MSVVLTAFDAVTGIYRPVEGWIQYETYFDIPSVITSLKLNFTAHIVL